MTKTVTKFLAQATMQNHPLRKLVDFLDEQTSLESAKKYSEMRFIGYVLKIDYDEAVIITSDPFKAAVGGVPRGSFLIMVIDDFEDVFPHFTLLRVADAADTPLSSSVAQTYFELQKKSMPELDRFTQAELQWGALRTAVLGMFYPDPDKADRVEFSGDVNNFVSAHHYRVYAPNAALQDLIINALVQPAQRFELGELRVTECRLDRLLSSAASTANSPVQAVYKVPVYISPADFLGTRTAMFGKTRLGKSNIVKLLAEDLIVSTDPTHPRNQQGGLPANSVGQLIFDQDGEYSNDNPQNASLASKYPSRCHVYALTPKASTPSKPLKLNFYEHPQEAHQVLASLLRDDKRHGSIYVDKFASVPVPDPAEVAKLPIKEQKRPRRKVQMYWALLHAAGYPADQARLRNIPGIGFDPEFNGPARAAAYAALGRPVPPQGPSNLDELHQEMRGMALANRATPLQSAGSGGALFDSDDVALLDFIEPKPGSAGNGLIMAYRKYHDPQAGMFVKEILALLDKGQTVLLDLGNANEAVMRYFSTMLTDEVFQYQVTKFTNDELGEHYIEVYFEEAHNLFPRTDTDLTNIYSRLAKEGAKYHIGMVYATQSPTTISKDLLKNTENWFVTHLSAREDVKALADLNVVFEPVQDEILRARTPGYVRLLTRSHRFVVSGQARQFLSPAVASASLASTGSGSQGVTSPGSTLSRTSGLGSTNGGRQQSPAQTSSRSQRAPSSPHRGDMTHSDVLDPEEMPDDVPTQNGLWFPG